MHRTKNKISGMIPHGFKAEKCKVSLRMAMSRMKLLRNKREVQVRQMRRDVAQLLQSGQDQTARIRVEHVIREEKTMAAYELLELYCELIVARLPIIDSQKTCPIDLQEAISSLIFASPRCADVQELMDVHKHILTKYGKEFTTAALELKPDCGVSHMIIEKLSAKAPDTETKIKTLKSIAEEHGIEWDAKALLDELEKTKNDLLMGTTQFHSASQVTTDNSVTSSVNTSTQPTQFLSASRVAMGYSATNLSSDIDQTSSEPKPTQFLSASEVTMGHLDFNSSTSTSTGLTSFVHQKNGDTAEDDVEAPPDDPVPQRGGFISSTGSIIYPPPPPPFMSFEESVPSGTQPELTSLGNTPQQEKPKHKYKDAKEAARVAAESAEMAQMAAKATADLARNENNARGKARVEEDWYSTSDDGSVEDAPEQSETKNLKTHNDQALKDFQSDEEEEVEMTTHHTGPERENDHVIWDYHEPSAAAVFDQGDSDIEDNSTNLLDTFSQPKKDKYSSTDSYWREKADNKKQDRIESVCFEDSTKDSPPPRFVSSSAPAFDSDTLSSDNEAGHNIKADKDQPKYIYSEEPEEKDDVFASSMRNKNVSSDDDSDETALGLNFGKLTGGLKNKGYRQPPYVTDATPLVETLDDHDIYVSSRNKKLPFSDVHDVETSVVSVEIEKGRGGQKLASRFDENYFDREDEVDEPQNQLVKNIGRHANKNIIKHSRKTRDYLVSNTRKEDHFGENRHPELSDEESTNDKAVTEKPELDEDQMMNSVPPPSSVRPRRPPDYESLAAHFHSLRTNKR